MKRFGARHAASRASSCQFSLGIEFDCQCAETITARQNANRGATLLPTVMKCLQSHQQKGDPRSSSSSPCHHRRQQQREEQATMQTNLPLVITSNMCATIGNFEIVIIFQRRISDAFNTCW